MKMQIREFASLTGVSVRTLHYYDEIGLLAPSHLDENSGYRLYDETSLARMQEILRYREMDFSLKCIPKLLSATRAEREQALVRQKARLRQKMGEIQKAIERIEEAEKESDGPVERPDASLTALLSAFARAFHHQTAEKPIFDDTMAGELLAAEEQRRISGYILGGVDFLAPEKKGDFRNVDETLQYLIHTQFAPTPLARARFCEDRLQTAMRTGTTQYVILGAGLDTFAFRNPAFAGRYPVFEVDHPAAQADKLRRIRQAGWKIPEGLRFVPADLSKEDLKSALLRAGFDGGKKTFFSWLGVSYYLSMTDIERMLACLSELSAEGSTILFDYAQEDVFASEDRRIRNMIAMAAAAGEPMQSAFSEGGITKLLEKHGFLIYEWLQPGDIQKNYFGGRNDHLSAFDQIGFIQAVRK